MRRFHAAAREEKPAACDGQKPGSQARGDVDAVAHKVAVALLDDITQMNADAELDAALGRQAVALNEAVLDLDGATNSVDDATELDEASIPSSLDDAPMMAVDVGIDQIAAQPPQPRQCAILVSGRETAVTDGVRICALLPFAGTTSLLASPTCE